MLQRFGSFALGFVTHDQTNISADSLGVAIDKPFTEVLGSAALYICVLDRLHFDIVWFDFLELSQLRISNHVPIPEPIIGEYKAPSMKPIIATRINSAPATALGRTLLRIVFNAVRKGSNFQMSSFFRRERSQIRISKPKLHEIPIRCEQVQSLA